MPDPSGIGEAVQVCRAGQVFVSGVPERGGQAQQSTLASAVLFEVIRQPVQRPSLYGDRQGGGCRAERAVVVTLAHPAQQGETAVHRLGQFVQGQFKPAL